MHRARDQAPVPHLGGDPNACAPSAIAATMLVPLSAQVATRQRAQTYNAAKSV